jgi:multiple sugar transport system ATP-binding protein
MVYVTHDQVEAMTLGQRVAVLKDGVLQQYDAPLEVYRRPANLFVAGFIGTPAINQVAGHLSDEAAGSLFECEGLRLPLRRRPFTGPATLAVRPEAMTLLVAGSPQAALASKVTRLEPLGNELLVHLRGPAGGGWVARTDPERRFAVDQEIGVGLEARLEPERA